MSNTNVITIQDFRMDFGPKTVIENLSFEVKQGETFGFLGSNGSGKTTTIRALLGIYQPTAGTLLVNGQRYNPRMNDQLGYLPEERGLYKKESVIDCMIYFGRLKGLSAAEARKRSMDYLERVDIADKAKERLDKLSGGQQQKIQLGVTILNRPQLLILDEPTKGFDPVNRRLLMDILEDLTAKGTTTVLVTHQMEEVERLCDRVVLLKDGKRRLYGGVEEVKQQYGSNAIYVRYEGELPKSEKLYAITNHTAQNALLIPQSGVTTQQIFATLAKDKALTITKFEVQQASLDDIFIKIYQDEGGNA